MIERVLNLFRLASILIERGNWPLIRRSRKQLLDFIFCRSEINPKSLPAALLYWFHMLKGLDALVWRLETFGFLFLPNADDAQKKQLNCKL